MVAQIQGDPRFAWLLCLPGEFVCPIVEDAAVLCFLQNLASLSLQHVLKTSDSPGIFQVFCARLGLLKCPALWTKCLPVHSLSRVKMVIVRLSIHNHVDQCNIYAYSLQNITHMYTHINTCRIYIMCVCSVPLENTNLSIYPYAYRSRYDSNTGN